MDNIVSIQSRRFPARSVSGRSGTLRGQTVGAMSLHIDPAEMAQWEKTVSHTTLATVMVAFLLAAAIGAFGLPGLM